MPELSNSTKSTGPRDAEFARSSVLLEFLSTSGQVVELPDIDAELFGVMK
jgi:hypothetical protein